jgi:hypothetical protein
MDEEYGADEVYDDEPIDDEPLDEPYDEEIDIQEGMEGQIDVIPADDDVRLIDDNERYGCMSTQPNR